MAITLLAPAPSEDIADRIHPDCTPEERALAIAYHESRKVEQDAAVTLATHFSNVTDAFIAREDYAGAIAYLQRMPGTVEKSFLIDRVRVARGDFKKD